MTLFLSKFNKLMCVHAAESTELSPRMNLPGDRRGDFECASFKSSQNILGEMQFPLKSYSKKGKNNMLPKG